jgi:hypothetical protein
VSCALHAMTQDMLIINPSDAISAYAEAPAVPSRKRSTDISDLSFSIPPLSRPPPPPPNGILGIC